MLPEHMQLHLVTLHFLCSLFSLQTCSMRKKEIGDVAFFVWPVSEIGGAAWRRNQPPSTTTETTTPAAQSRRAK
jgi:hypothetical protein